MIKFSLVLKWIIIKYMIIFIFNNMNGVTQKVNDDTNLRIDL
jgi:hypothetical protein